ncbi:hypothetical protein PAEPH01_0848 [Pancytospora epiphaga]|nr:hypothetical protein PAEPH01_0848 [Pancytospora epiphaga]
MDHQLLNFALLFFIDVKFLQPPEAEAIMEGYLMKIYKINERAANDSTIDSFYHSIVDHLNSSPFGHEMYVPSLYRALYHFKNVRLISLIYQIAGKLNTNTSLLSVDAIVPKNLLKIHFRRRSIRKSMLGYLVRNSITFLDEKIIDKLLMDPTFVDSNLCHYIEKYREYTAKFMAMTNPECFYKQLFMIEHCQIDFNTDYFLAALGSISKIKANQAYEALTVHFYKKSNLLGRPHVKVKEGGISFDNTLLLTVTKRLVVESSVNFISFGFNFIKDRDSIETAHTKADLDRLNLIISNYIDKQLLLEDFLQLELTRSKEFFNNEEIHTLEKDFSYLFDRKYKRSSCGCLEI